MLKKRALVTGGTRGIGKAISLMLIKNGYNVIINYRSNQKMADKLVEEIENLKKSGQAPKEAGYKFIQFDVSEYANAQTIITQEIQEYGPISVLILNAGIRKDALFPLMSTEEWDSVLDINLKSFYYITKPIVKSMFEQKYGKVVVMSSTSGQVGMPGQTNYCASKAGLIGAAKALGVELARKNINVNIVAPGFIETDMTGDLQEQFNNIKKTIPARRIGSADDVANVVEFLISKKANYLVSQVIGVNGGLYS